MTPVVPVVARSGTCLYGLKKGVPPPLPGGKEHRSFFGKILVSPYVRESKTVLSRFDARDSGFRNICQWNVGRFPFNKNSGLKHWNPGSPKSRFH